VFMCCVAYVFFFQAEDGIRDLTVTGVQTCALPIWRRILVFHARERLLDAGRCGRSAPRREAAPGHEIPECASHQCGCGHCGANRSEERRVGKEWRSWESPNTATKHNSKLGRRRPTQ